MIGKTLVSKKSSKDLVRIILFVIVVTAFPYRVMACFETDEIGGKAIGMGGAWSGVCNDPNTIFFNPAGLENIGCPCLSCTYTELFSIKELQTNSIIYVHPLRNYGAISLSFHGFGTHIYREEISYLSYAKYLLTGIYLGINLKYMVLRVEIDGVRQGTKGYGVDCGLVYKVEDRLWLGLAIKNINRPVVGEALPKELTMGVGIRPLGRLILSIDYKRVHGKIYYPPETSAGCEFQVTNWFYTRFGIKTDPSLFTFGVGFKVNGIDLDYAGIYHPVLPLTHQMGFTISL
ncbi:MAG: hypothetical protein QME40_07665 [bacterium]|nr:hypothetical protein [bacterium]